jgi:hypothetical protein
MDGILCLPKGFRGFHANPWEVKVSVREKGGGVARGRAEWKGDTNGKKRGGMVPTLRNPAAAGSYFNISHTGPFLGGNAWLKTEAVRTCWSSRFSVLLQSGEPMGSRLIERALFESCGMRDVQTD